MSKLVRPIPDGNQQGWKVEVNGLQVAASHVRVSHPKFGTLSWGQRPESSVGWMWEEVGGGGHGVVPFCVIDEMLFIGLVRQERQTMPSGWAWNIPRGFLDPGQTHLAGAQAELAEEVGYLSPQERLFELEADPASSNSTFFDVSGGGGFVWFGLEILPGELVKCASGEHEFKFREVIQPQSMMGERITACRFFPWKTAATCGDMFSNAGVARLLINRLKLIKFL